MAGFTSGLADHGTGGGGDRRDIVTDTATDTTGAIVTDITAGLEPGTAQDTRPGSATHTTTCIENAMGPTETGSIEPAPLTRRTVNNRENRLSQTTSMQIRTETFSAIRVETGRAMTTRRVTGRTQRARQTRAAMPRRATAAISGVHRTDRLHKIALHDRAGAAVDGDKRLVGL